MSPHGPIISVDQVSKRFPLRRPPGILRRFKKTSRKSERHFWALDNVSFDLAPGDSLAIVGRNGAGKSTLLSVIQQTLQPTRGRVRVNGSIGSLLELGAGFHPELTGRENIHLNCSLNGMTRAQVDGVVEEIVEFSELEGFIDQPLKTYSSGMHVRLGFSVAIHIDPDIVIIDEALSVGDAQFQAKCLERIHAFKQREKTLIFVTHKLDTIHELCERALWLDAGRVRAIGPTEEVVREYTARPPGKHDRTHAPSGPSPRPA